MQRQWQCSTICEEKGHKVLKCMAAKGRTSTGWFFDVKLHIFFNTHGEVVKLAITPGNTDNRMLIPDMLKDIPCKLIDDKGYLSQKLFSTLFEQGITLITKIKKNMRNCLMYVKDKLMRISGPFLMRVDNSQQ